MVVADGIEGEPYDAVGGDSLIYSPDSSILAYAAMKDQKVLVVRNGEEGPGFDGVGRATLVFSPQGNRLAYIVREKQRWCAIIDETRTKFYDTFEGGVVFSPDGTGACAVQNEGRAFVVRDGVECNRYDGGR